MIFEKAIKKRLFFYKYTAFFDFLIGKVSSVDVDYSDKEFTQGRVFSMKTSDTIEILVSTVSLGCVKNFVDTEVAAGSLLRMGIGMTGDDAEANVMLYYF